ncbi:hypothetical protein HaLaN_22651, partial [Haematococcus lacustris]
MARVAWLLLWAAQVTKMKLAQKQAEGIAEARSGQRGPCRQVCGGRASLAWPVHWQPWPPAASHCGRLALWPALRASCLIQCQVRWAR